MSAQPLGTAIAPVFSTGGLKNGVEPIVLGSLAPGKGFHNTVGPLFFCTLGGRPSRPREGPERDEHRHEHRTR